MGQNLELRRDESVPDGVRRLARELVDPSIADLESVPAERRSRITHRARPLRAADRQRFHTAVHDTRKRMKRMRALLRLVRGELGDDAYRFENESYRDTSRILADVRDAQVMIDTLDHVADVLGDAAPKPLLADVRRSLVGNLGAASRTMTHRGAVDEAVARLRRARARIDTWPLQQDSAAAFAPGLERVYKRGRKDLAAVLEEPSVDAFHEWRKRVKYLWHQLEVLTPAWPDLFDAMTDEADDVADLLGDDHDLAVLQAWVLERPERYGAGSDVQHLVAVVESRRQDLEAEALRRGRRLFVEAPAEFTERITAYWDLWR